MQKHIEEEEIVRNIIIVRDKKVMLDQYLAELYKVDNKQLKRQVRRNLERFPEDFMFQLTLEEIKNLRSQIGTSSWGGTRYRPMAFTEQGVAKLSSVLNSEKAINVNVAIIRTFVLIKQSAILHKDLYEKIIKLEKKYNKNFKEVFTALEYLMSKKQTEEDFKTRQRIGFKP